MAEVRRTKDGRPYILDTETGKEKPYTRVTTFVDAIDDKHGLTGWKERHVALGMALRPDLVALVSSHDDDKREIGKAVEQAKDAALASYSANAGSALHKYTEKHDKGQPLPKKIPAPWDRDVTAFQKTTSVLNPEFVEVFLVNDELKTAGTADRLYRMPDDRLIVGDTKTGSVEHGVLKIAMQLAVYSASKGYDPESGERSDHGIDRDWGLLVHLPAGTGTCELVWLKLWKAWPAVLTCRDVRELRNLDWNDMTEVSDWEDFI